MKKSLLFINGHLIVGGVERSLVNLLRSLDFDEYEVTLLLLEGEGDYIKEVPETVRIVLYDVSEAMGPLSVTLKRLFKEHKYGKFLFRLMFNASSRGINSAYRLFPKLAGMPSVFDAVIAYRPGICADVAAYGFKAMKKLVWWHHGEINLSEKQIDGYKKCWRKFDKLITVTDGCKRMLMDRFGYGSNFIDVISNPIISADLEEKASAESNVFGPAPDVLKLVSVGRLAPEKKFTAIPEIGRLLSASGTAYKWIVIGDGEDRKEIERLITNYGLGNNIELKGALPNPYPYIKEADILVHPSPVESQGIVLLEALSLGTYCIACDSIGAREVLNGKAGLIANDYHEIVRFIKSNS